MIPPAKRIWLYPDRTFTRPRDLEIIVLGEPEAIAPFVVALRHALERWEGFEAVTAITMGEAPIGFRVSRSKWAQHDDPVAEAMLLLRTFPIEWFGEAGSQGVVGSW